MYKKSKKRFLNKNFLINLLLSILLVVVSIMGNWILSGLILIIGLLEVIKIIPVRYLGVLKAIVGIWTLLLGKDAFFSNQWVLGILFLLLGIIFVINGIQQFRKI